MKNVDEEKNLKKMIDFTFVSVLLFVLIYLFLLFSDIILAGKGREVVSYSGRLKKCLKVLTSEYDLLDFLPSYAPSEKPSLHGNIP